MSDSFLASPVYVELRTTSGKVRLDPSQVESIEDSGDGCVVVSTSGTHYSVEHTADEVAAILAEGNYFRTEASLNTLVRLIAKEVRDYESKKRIN